MKTKEKQVSNQMEKESTEEKMISAWREFTAAIKKLLHMLQF